MKAPYNILVILVSFLFVSCRNEAETLFSELNSGKTGIDFRNLFVEDESLNVATYIYFYNGGGVAIGDINNDGLQDILFTGNMVKNRLFLNKGNFEFENITTRSGVAEKQGWCTGATMVDINGDGKLDIYICRSADDDPEKRKNLLFINNGDLTFTDQAEKYGLADNAYSTQASFFDYDKDGDLDCFVLNHSLSRYATGVTENPEMRNIKIPANANHLYRNDNGHFNDVSDQAGIISNVLSFGLGIALSDFNNDGWTDIYISNDFNESDYFYLNNKNGSFTESFANCMDMSSLNSMGSDAADYNNDGLTDLLTLDMLPEDNYLQKTHSGSNNLDKINFLISKGFQAQYVRNMLQKNNGDGTFSEVGQLAGISNTDWSWAALFCDFDGDSNKDLFISNGFVKDYTDLDFMNFATDKLFKANKSEPMGSFKEIVAKMPTIEIPNYIFKNSGSGLFDNKTKQWGLNKPIISSGAAYADLDNDGDMDLIVNNTNDYATVYENNSLIITKNNFVRIILEGTTQNRNGVGTKIRVFCNGDMYYQEQFPVRGYQSSVDMVLNFGLGKAKVIDSLIVIWPNDKIQALKNVKANQTISINIKNATATWVYDSAETEKKYFKTASSLNFKHEENEFNDFTVQTLLLNYLSRQGPCMAKTDVNKDGREDLFIGGAKGQAGELFIQLQDGSFINKPQPSFANDVMSEDVAAEFFDADGDGDMDLYVGSGGYEYSENDPALQGRLYFNDGKGNFVKKISALPDMRLSTGCVKAADIDGDGDMDLFVGGRVVPGRYPVTPESKILLNDGKGNFTDVTTTLAPDIQKTGMLTDALWIDLNNDKLNDLVVVGEWMPIRVFINYKGKLTDESSSYIKFPSSGWWNRILAEDFDGDGDKDLVIGNLGLNAQFHASEKEPISLYYKDFDHNGSIDPLFCYYIQGISYPAAPRDDLMEQLPMLKKKFLKYSTYASATINDLFSKEELQDAALLKADILNTIYLQNGPDGFTIKPLPIEAQYSPVYAIASIDANGDGKKDLLLAGNNVWTRIKYGRYSANHGILLIGDGKGNFSYVPQMQSGLNVRGVVRSMLQIKTGNEVSIFFGMNNAPAISYWLN
jgi:hypothetical protein